MPRLIPEPVQAQLTGLQNMTAHARRLFQQINHHRDDVYKAEAYEAEQRGQIADAETFAAMRKDGTWDKLEQVLRDPRSGTPAERELYRAENCRSLRRRAGARIPAQIAGRAECGDGQRPREDGDVRGYVRRRCGQ